jgi:hypothetical protein
LGTSLENSQRREAEAEQAWRRQWRVSRVQRPRNSWI